MKDVTLSQKEQARLSVLNSVLEYQVPIAQAAEVLGVSHAKIQGRNKGGRPGGVKVGRRGSA